MEGQDFDEVLVATQQVQSRKRNRKQVVSWSKEDAKRLLLAVEAEPVLWNHTAAVYKDRDKRDLAWSNIAAILGQPPDECTHKWNSLRVNYRVKKRIIYIIIISIVYNNLLCFYFSQQLQK